MITLDDAQRQRLAEMGLRLYSGKSPLYAFLKERSALQTATEIMMRENERLSAERTRRELTEAIGEEGCGPVFAALAYPTA